MYIGRYTDIQCEKCTPLPELYTTEILGWEGLNKLVVDYKLDCK